MLNFILLFVIGTGFLIFLKWRFKLNFLNPIFFISAYWILYILFSALFSIVFNFTLYWDGVFPISIMLFSFICGSFLYIKLCSFLIQRKKINYPQTDNNILFSSKKIKWIIIIFSGLGLTAIIWQLLYLNIQIESFQDLLKTANKISYIRYEGGTDMPKPGLILMSFLYSSAFFSAIYYRISRGIFNRIISLLPFLIILIITITNGVKTGFLYVLIIWISGSISFYLFDKKQKSISVKKTGIQILFAILIILLLIPATQALRGHNKNSTARSLSYFCSFNAFTIWYHTNTNKEITPFKYTLSGIHNIFYNEREVGLYGDENVEVGKYKNIVVNTNVYTMARGLIQDFSLIGAVVLLFISGFISQHLYSFTKYKNIVCMCLLSLFYSIILWSFTVNMINYNTIILSWVISIIFIFFATSKNTAHIKG